jgi:dTDP-glucose 4,6-dehydratase
MPLSSPQRLLVTGAAGFIGSNFAHQLLDSSSSGPLQRLVVLDKLTYAGNPENLAGLEKDPRYRFVKGDIGDGPLVFRLLEEENIGTVVNFAAESHVDRSIDSPSDFIQTNIQGTFVLLEAALARYRTLPPEARQAFRFLHVSTDEVFGSLAETDPAFTEETAYSPNSPYSASKASADHLVRSYHHTFGLPTLTSNCSNNYGPRQFPEKLIPLMILNALDGKPLPVYGQGRNIRDWLHVEDHCRAIRAILAEGDPGETYNVGGNAEKRNIEIVRFLCSLLDRLAPGTLPGGYASLITFVADRPGHDHRYAINFSKLHARTGWQPEHTFESGLEATVRWYLDNRPWCEAVTSGRYRRERLGIRASSA